MKLTRITLLCTALWALISISAHAVPVTTMSTAKMAMPSLPETQYVSPSPVASKGLQFGYIMCDRSDGIRCAESARWGSHRYTFKDYVKRHAGVTRPSIYAVQRHETKAIIYFTFEGIK